MSSTGHKKRRTPKKGLLVRFQNHVQIEKPIDEVFAFVADFRNLPKWNYYVTSVEQEAEGPPGLRARYRQNRRHDQQDFEVTHYVPPSFIAIETLPGSVPAFRMRFRFLRTGPQRTMVLDAWELDTVSHRLRARLFARWIRRAAAENLYKLKELLEEGSTTLQNGRTASL